MFFGHAIRPASGVPQLGVVLGQSGHLLFEKVVYIPHSGVQVVLVGGAAQRLDQTAQLLQFSFGARAQILVVLQEHLQMRVLSKHRVAGESREEHFVHCHGFLESRQILPAGNREVNQGVNTVIVLLTPQAPASFW